MKTLTLLTILLLGYTMAMCQSANYYQELSDKLRPEEKKLAKTIGQKVKMPLSLDTSCKSIFTIVKLAVRNSKVLEEINFPIDCPTELQAEFRKNISVFKSTKWTEIFAAKADKNNFNVIIPYVYSFEAGGCYDNISKRDFSSKISASLNHNDSITTYAIHPIRIQVTRMVTPNDIR